MNKFLSALAVLAIAASALAAPQPALPKADNSWKKMSDSDSVLVHSKEVPNSDVVAFRGETIVDAPIAKVANVIIDISREKEWVFHLVESKTLRQVSTYERIEYNHTASGFFMVRDRDFVFRAKAEFNKEKRQIVFNLRSVEDSLMPENGKVRGNIDSGRYILTQISPDKTHLVVEIHADPKGSLPKWLVNLFQKSWPARTLNGIRTQCAKADVLEHPGIKAYFADLDAAPAMSATKKPAAANGPGALQ